MSEPLASSQLLLFRKVKLFGEYAECEMPISFIDLSGIREVPDHQEVYIDASQAGSTPPIDTAAGAPFSPVSVIIELNDYRDDIDDIDAYRFYFNDLSKTDEAIDYDILRHVTTHTTHPHARSLSVCSQSVLGQCFQIQFH